jgi:hypothetical protein
MNLSNERMNKTIENLQNSLSELQDYIEKIKEGNIISALLFIITLGSRRKLMVQF